MQFRFVLKSFNLVFVGFFISVKLLSAEVMNDEKPIGLTITCQVWSYNSYSQQNMGFPIKAGYPVIQAQGGAVSVGYKFRRDTRIHTFSIFTTAPTSLTSDNGNGQNHLLASNNLSYHKSIIGYKLWLNLYEFGKISAKHSFSSGVLYEYRKLHYASGAIEKTNDINLYLGPCFQINYYAAPQWQVLGNFDAHFYFPYVNYGSLKTFSETGEQTLSSPYRAFYYHTQFSVGIRYRISNQIGITMAFSKDDLVGFANREPSFKVNDIIHHKLDRVYALTVGVDF